MYSVMIVEDELLARLALKNSISWEKYDIGEVYEAADGVEALDKFRKCRIDVMIVDINLPLMNGMELIKEIRKEDSKVKIIILSCLEDFQYAKEAIKENVSQYILKASMSLNELESAIKKVLGEIKSESGGSPYRWRKRQDEYEKKSSLLRRLLSGTEGNIGDADKIFHMPVCIAVVHVVFETEMNLNEDLLNKINFIKGIIGTSIKEEFPGCVVTLLGELYTVITECGKEEREKLANNLENVESLIMKYTSAKVRIGLSDLIYQQKEIRKGFLEAKRKLSYYTFCPGSNLLLPEKEAVLFWKKNGEECIAKLKMGLEERRAAGILEYDIGWPALSENFLEEFRKWWEVLVYRSAALYEQKNSEKTVEIQEAVNEAVRKIRKEGRIKDAEETYFAFLDIIEKLCRNRVKYSVVVEKTIAYTQKFFGQPITLADAAEAVHVSPSYLSMIFGREYGLNYTEYLNGLRIEKAKILLQAGNEKLSEIANKCGFNDHAYFTRIFKKNVGVSPYEYRKKTKGY